MRTVNVKKKTNKQTKPTPKSKMKKEHFCKDLCLGVKTPKVFILV